MYKNVNVDIAVLYLCIHCCFVCVLLLHVLLCVFFLFLWYVCRSGNEPDIFAVWLFNWAKRSDLTQKWSRRVLQRRYSNDQMNGEPGNDDCNTTINSLHYIIACQHLIKCSLIISFDFNFLT